LDGLRAQLAALISAGVDPIPFGFALHYSPLWEAPNQKMKDARDKLYPEFHTTALEVYGARKKLSEGGEEGGAAGAAGAAADDDDEVQDVTAVETARRAAQAQADMIEIGDEEDDEPIAARGGAGAAAGPSPRGDTMRPPKKERME
jgi:hypothetical protein